MHKIHSEEQNMLRWNRPCWILFLLLLRVSLLAQTVTVVNEANNAPIALATIQEKGTDLGTITNEIGRAELKGFSKDAILLIRHPSFRPKQVKYSELAAMGYVIALTEEIYEMADVVVSANKWEQKKEEIPQQIAEFSPEEIALAEPPTAADVLTMNGQVFVQKSQLGGGSPIIRGFAANSVLIVIDGVRMNNAIYRSGNLQNVITLDPNNLQGAEVVFGPGSVIYGSDALGGVMDFHTKTPTFSNEGPLLKGQGFVRYASAAKASTTNFQFEFNQPKFASFSSLTYSSFGDLRAGANRPDDFPDFGKRFEFIERRNGEDVIVQNDNVNRQVASGYTQLNALQKFRWRLGSFADFTYAFHYSSSSDIPRYDRLILRENNVLRNAEWYYGPQEWQMHSLQTRFYYPNKFFDQMKVTAAIQFVEESRHDRRYTSDFLRSRTEKVDAVSFNIDFEKAYLNGEIYYGIEGVSNDVSSTAVSTNLDTNEELPASTRYPDGGSDYNSIAAYLSSKNHLTDQLILSSGVRYSYISLRSRFEDKTFFNFPFDEISLNNGAITGSLGLVYQPKPGWKLNALLSSGFRAPNVDDAGKVFDSEPGTVVVPNPGLKPEVSYNFEYGFGRKVGERLKIEFVNFFSLLRDALVRRPFTFNGQSQIIYDGELSNVFAEVNVGRAFIWGFSLNTKVQLYPNLILRSNLTFTDGEDTIENIPLRHVTPIFGETSLSFKRNKFSSRVIISYSGGIDFEDLAPSEQNKPHLYTTDGALPWAIISVNNSYKLNERFTINLNLENLMDTHYRPYSSGISAPGFNAILSVRGTF